MEPQLAHRTVDEMAQAAGLPRTITSPPEFKQQYGFVSKRDGLTWAWAKA